MQGTYDIPDPFTQGFSDDPCVSTSLPAQFYTDPAIFELERERIFFRSWLFVGHITDIPEPGDYFTTKVFNQNVIVIRGQNGEIRAFYNVCRHRGHELLDTKGRVTRITCPYHAWTYALDGKLVGVRNADRVKNFCASNFPLTPVRLETLAGLIFINLDSDARPLADAAEGLDAEIRAFAPECDTLVHAHRDRHVMKCNWKIAVENWSECYHCAVVHKPLATEFIDFDTFRIELNPLYQRQRMKLRENVMEDAHKDAACAANGEQASWTLLPNLGIQIVAGGYVMTSLWQPIDADHCQFVEDWYLPSAKSSEHQRKLIRFRAEHTQPEDVAVCEGCATRAAQPRFRTGPSYGRCRFHRTQRTRIAPHPALGGMHAQGGLTEQVRTHQESRFLQEKNATTHGAVNRWRISWKGIVPSSSNSRT